VIRTLAAVNVYLLRHGDAEEGGAGSDAERRLTEDGRSALQRAQPTWQRVVGRVDRIYTSPLVRAKETAKVFAEAVGFTAAFEEVDCLAPDAEPEGVARLVLADAADGRGAVAFVGHEPNLGQVLAFLLQGQGAIPLEKGMVVGVRMESGTSLGGRLLCCLGSSLAAELGPR